MPNAVLQRYLIHIPACWGKTPSEHSLIALSQWDQYAPDSMMHDGYLNYYRPKKRTSNCSLSVMLYWFHFFFINLPFFKKTKQQLSSRIVASGHGEHFILIFQTKSCPKCQTDVDSVCSQTFSHILGLIRVQQRVLLVFAPLHTRPGSFLQTQAICLSDFIVNVNARVPFSDQGDQVWLVYSFL